MAKVEEYDISSSPEAITKRDRSRSPLREHVSQPDWWNTQQFKLWKIWKKGVTGNNQISYINISDDKAQPPRICFGHPKMKKEHMLYVSFPLNPERTNYPGNPGPPDFILNEAGSSTQKKKEHIDVALSIEDESMQKFFLELDAWCKEEVVKNPDLVFGSKTRPPSEEEIRIKHAKSSIVYPSNESYKPWIRTRLTVAGPDFLLTNIIFMHPDGSSEEGKGWLFLKERMDKYRMKNYRAIPTLIFRNVSVFPSNKEFQVRLDISSIMFQSTGSRITRKDDLEPDRKAFTHLFSDEGSQYVETLLGGAETNMQDSPGQLEN